jgi:hypothetical protein
MLPQAARLNVRINRAFTPTNSRLRLEGEPGQYAYSRNWPIGSREERPPTCSRPSVRDVERRNTPSVKKRNTPGRDVIDPANDVDLIFVDHLPKNIAPLRDLLRGETHILFRNSSHEFRIL